MDTNSDVKSKTYKTVENNLHARLQPTFLKSYPHHVLPGYNLNKISYLEETTSESVLELYQEFPYCCDLPKPILPPVKLNRTVLNEDDPATELLALKSQIKDDVDRIVNYCKKHKNDFKVIHKNKLKWKTHENKSSTRLPRYAAEIAELLDQDPDPHFTGNYNWYYTGGSLNNIDFHGQTILLYPYMNELIASPIFKKSDILWKPILSSASKCELNDELFELRHNILNNTCMLLARFKNYCNFYTITNYNDELSIIELHKQQSKLPYVSADISKFNINQYSTVNSGAELRLWDLRKMKYIYNISIPEKNMMSDSWGHLRFHQTNSNILLYTNRCCLNYYDTRDCCLKPVLKLCPKKDLEVCESISLQISSRHESCHYLGTYHSFLMCDDRSPSSCVQQKWTHQFKSAPLLASVSNRNNEEFIVITSQLIGESAIILNTWKTPETPHSFHLPFQPPSILDTLNSCQTQGTCLDPIMRTRLELSNVGSTLKMDNDCNLYFFVQNSLGDIFYQGITYQNIRENSEENIKSCYALNLWEKAVLSQNPVVVPLTVTEKYNAKPIFKYLKNSDPVIDCIDDDQAEGEDYEPTWKKSIELLKACNDLFAPHLLEMWDVTENVQIPCTAPHEKVLSWLEHATEKDCSQILSQSQSQSQSQWQSQSQLQSQSQSQLENELLLSQINSQELLSASQEPNLSLIDDSNILQELLLPRVKTKSVKKKRKIR